jgi:glutamyl-tRNA synthetase
VWQNENLDDLVLLRSDGNPTYMLAVVVDDHDMGVTHIIRGDDHLTNGARQTQIYQALGWSVPAMAHIPLIHGPDGAKLSKRHGALGVEAYRAMGYLPAAMRNYLVRLGWAHGDQEIFSTEEMMAAFDLPAIGRAPARLDLAKLDNVNGYYIRQTPNEKLFDELVRALPYIAGGRELQAKLEDRPGLKRKILRVMSAVKERSKTLVELLENTKYVWGDIPSELDDKASGVLSQEARGLLADLISQLRLIHHEQWKPSTIESAVRAFADSRQVKLGAIAQPLRVAVTGRTTSPGVFDVLARLGKVRSLARIADQAIGPAEGLSAAR